MITKTWVFSIATVLVAWVAIQALVMRFTDISPGAVALFPSAGYGPGLPADMAISDAGWFWIMVNYDGPNLAKSLYSEGALLVLPAGLPGCLPLM